MRSARRYAINEEASVTEQEILEGLGAAVYMGDKEAAARYAIQAVEQHVHPLAAFDQALIPSITRVGEEFACHELFLPDLVMAGDAMKAASTILEAEIQRLGAERKSLGKVVLGTVAGDLHDIGKTITGTLLASHGFEVLDLGVDVPTQGFLEAVSREEPAILGMSSLLTVTASEQRRVIEALQEAGLRDSIKVMVGGGAITADFAANIGADGYAQNAEHGVRLAKQLLGLA
jgi:methanogenic corrinoid protein MtbC1